MARRREKVTDKLAVAVLKEVFEERLAVVQPELVALVADNVWKSTTYEIQPHRIETAVRQLLADGYIVSTVAETRGHRAIEVLQVADVRRRKVKVERTAARKRVLYARYLGWAQGNREERDMADVRRGRRRGETGLIGPAAETVLHASLLQAAPFVGYRLENPESGHASTIAGVPVGAAVDNAAAFTLGVGSASLQYQALFEVKSYRRWVYPSSSDQLAQLLLRAARLNNALPDARVVPVLICRRAEYQAFRMAQDLGFLIFQVRRQWVPGWERIEREKATEITQELGFDLTRLDEAGSPVDPYLRRQLIRTVPRQAPQTAERWQLYGRHFEEQYQTWGRRGVGNRAVALIRQGMRDADAFNGLW